MHDAIAQFHLNMGVALPGDSEEESEEDFIEDDDLDMDVFNDSEEQLEWVLEHSDDESSVQSGPLAGLWGWLSADYSRRFMDSLSSLMRRQDMATASHEQFEAFWERVGEEVHLGTWLQRHFPRDVIMPCMPGEKRPAYAHAGGTWTWARHQWEWERYDRRKPRDIGLLLHDLCVIDCDSHKAAEALEARFPELAEAPMEMTQRGRHYYLARSAKCNADGYYDGSKQRGEQVDFKTRCAGGGSGFVVVAPSTGKTWARSPWRTHPSGTLPTISDALLDAVAVPRHAAVPMALRFMAEKDIVPAPLVTRSQLLQSCGFIAVQVDMATEGRQAAGGVAAGVAALSLEAAPPPVEVVIPEQFSRDDFVQLERLAAGLELGASPDDAFLFASPEAYEARVSRIIALADFLDAPPAVLRPLKHAGPGGGHNAADLFRINRGWANDCILASRANEQRQLVRLDGSKGVAKALKHVPLLPDKPHDDRWFLHQVKRCCPLKAGDPVLPNIGRMEVALPSFVRRILLGECGHLALAGGGALAAVMNGDQHKLGPEPAAEAHQPSDYDLFIYGLEGDAESMTQQADNIVRRIASHLDVHEAVYVTRLAVTLRVEAGPNDPLHLHADPWYNVQIILRIAKDPFDVVCSFDLPPCKVLLTYEQKPPAGGGGPSKPRLHAYGTADFVLAVKHGAYPLDGRGWGRSTPFRVVKYCAKNFDALIPALHKRSRIKFKRFVPGPLTKLYKIVSPTRRFELKHADGFALLLKMEEAITPRTVTYRWSSAAGANKLSKRRVDASDVKYISVLIDLSRRSDYMEALNAGGALVFALMYAGGLALRRMKRLMGVKRRSNMLDAPLAWRQPWTYGQLNGVPDVSINEVLEQTAYMSVDWNRYQSTSSDGGPLFAAWGGEQ